MIMFNKNSRLTWLSMVVMAGLVGTPEWAIAHVGVVQHQAAAAQPVPVYVNPKQSYQQLNQVAPQGPQKAPEKTWKDVAIQGAKIAVVVTLYGGFWWYMTRRHSKTDFSSSNNAEDAKHDKKPKKDTSSNQQEHNWNNWDNEEFFQEFFGAQRNTSGSRNNHNQRNSQSNDSRSPQNNTPTLDDAYKAFGLNRNATNAEIRKRYRDLAKEWSPNSAKWANFTDEQKKDAEEKFKFYTNCRDKIEKSRGGNLNA